MFKRNYAKYFNGFKTRILKKINAMIVILHQQEYIRTKYQ